MRRFGLYVSAWCVLMVSCLGADVTTADAFKEAAKSGETITIKGKFFASDIKVGSYVVLDDGSEVSLYESGGGRVWVKAPVSIVRVTGQARINVEGYTVSRERPFNEQGHDHREVLSSASARRAGSRSRLVIRV